MRDRLALLVRPVPKRTWNVMLGVLLAAVTVEVTDAQAPDRPYTLRCERKEVADNHYTCQGQVEFEQDDMKIYADTLEFFELTEVQQTL